MERFLSVNNCSRPNRTSREVCTLGYHASPDKYKHEVKESNEHGYREWPNLVVLRLYSQFLIWRSVKVVQCVAGLDGCVERANNVTVVCIPGQ
jgi:hypothetical protein